MVLAWQLAAVGLPQIDPVRATMVDSPRSGIGLALLDDANRLHYLRTSYRLGNSRVVAEVYLSRDAYDFRFGPANFQLSPTANPVLLGSKLGYRVLKGKPSYLQNRRDGLWILYVFPDELVDVAGFVQDFNDCLQFFETRMPKAALADCLPSLVGSVQGVR